MADLSTLNITINYSSVREATEALNDLAKAAEHAYTALAKLAPAPAPQGGKGAALGTIIQAAVDNAVITASRPGGALNRA